MNAVQDHYACVEGLTMMHMDHGMPIWGGIILICHLRCINSGDQNRCLGGESQQKRAILLALSIMNAVQDHYACIEGLTMMHMKHAMPICGGIMHLCHLRCTI